MSCDKEFDECCKSGDLKKLVSLVDKVDIVSFTKQCIMAMENKQYHTVEYILELSDHNVYIGAKDYYLIREACRKNLLTIAKKIICTTKDNLSPSQMIQVAYENEALDIVLYVMKLFSIFPSYVKEIFCMACDNKHIELIKYFQQQYKNFYYDYEAEDIIIYVPPLLKQNKQYYVECQKC